jgi:uncharacterized protein (UPF0276 family)
MSRSSPVRAAGVGLRLPHLASVLRDRPDAAWFEIHPENYLANPLARDMLAEIARHYPISVHSVGISAGSASGLDRAHVARVRELMSEVKPFLLSGHLAWSTHDGEYLNDLLPLPYNAQSLDLICGHIGQIQDALGMAFHLENPSNYLGFAHSTMPETEFLSETVRRTGCRLLCDVSNVQVSAHNMGYDARRYLDELPAHAIGELHLGGFELEAEADGGSVIIDTHDRPIAEAAWQLHAHAIARFGRLPTLIEWDNRLPSLDELLAQARRADGIAAAATELPHAIAV